MHWAYTRGGLYSEVYGMVATVRIFPPRACALDGFGMAKLGAMAIVED
jgi:hypothetical protein